MIFLLKYRKTLIIAAAILALIIAVYWYAKRDKIAVVEVPNDQPGAAASEAESQKANELARAMYSNFDNYGVLNFYLRPMQPFEEFLKVSDKVFVMTYNRFNQLYGMSGNGTLREWFNDDAFSSNDWQFIETLVFPRMDRLNLT